MAGTRSVDLYDTTLRDGTQRAGISLSVDDKLKILARLDRLGMPYVEGGWPGSNPKDAEFFARARSRTRATSVLTCFGMTRRPRIACDDDAQLAALVEAGCGARPGPCTSTRPSGCRWTRTSPWWPSRSNGSGGGG